MESSLRTCSRCGCTMLDKHFGIKKSGEMYKLCNQCRKQCRVSKTENYGLVCKCGAEIDKRCLKIHVHSSQHKKWLGEQRMLVKLFEIVGNTIWV